MSITIWILGALALALVLAYFNRTWLAWVAPGALLAAKLGMAQGFDSAWFLALAIPFGLAALVLGPFGLRRVLVTPAAFRIVAPILPQMSATEKAALDAGTVWWDRELFSGDPSWRKLLDFQPRGLAQRELEFLAGPVEELCRRETEHGTAKRGDLAPETWEFIRKSGFLGMIIPAEYGGLGFSALAHSAVVAKLSSRCAASSVTVMVPNSLGPAELILHYGTDEQKRLWLPRLARGEDIPCFALTEPGAGSDAASIGASGVVCRAKHEGRETLGIRLDWNKRYITLAPVATVLGLAFQLRDPERLLGGEVELGITCALVPASVPGVELGERHDPLGVPFLNGPTRGRGVFVPLDAIIGGPARAGQGWQMLMQCLAAGRGISLPSLSCGAAQLALRTVGAYATVREQFGLPIGRFEGVEEPLGRIGGLTYAMNAARLLTLGAIDAGEKPSVLTAIVKRWSTESMRAAINDAMDVVGGAGICRGPRNVLAGAYTATPIGVTVEGANILTRSMIVFGQGALRCHPFAQEEIRAAGARDLAAFDRAFFGHVGFVFHNFARSFALSLARGRIAAVPPRGEVGGVLQRLTRLSASFAFCADVAMGTLGGDLKRKETLTGRLADALAWMYYASAAAQRFHADGEPEAERPYFRWATRHALHQAETALAELAANFPLRPAAWVMRLAAFPLGRIDRAPSDRLTASCARGILEGGEARVRLSRDVYVPPLGEPGLGELERALALVLAARPAEKKIKDALRARRLEKHGDKSLRARALAAGVITDAEAASLEAAEQARDSAVQVDAFAPEAAAGTGRRREPRSAARASF